MDEVLGLRFVEPVPEKEAEAGDELKTPIESENRKRSEGGVEVSEAHQDEMGESEVMAQKDRSVRDGKAIDQVSEITLVDRSTSGSPNDNDKLSASNSSLEIELEAEVGETSDVQSTKTHNRTVIEYIRSSNRIKPHHVVLPPPISTPNTTPRALQPLPARLRTYLHHLQSDTAQITSLPPDLQPIVAIIRFCIIDSLTHSPGFERGWRQSEVEAILQACLGTYFQWTRESRGDVPSKSQLEIRYPSLSTRNSQLVAHLQATMTDSVILAEALLLSNHSDEEVGVELSHLEVYKFYSGQVLHLFLNKVEIEGWKWQESDQVEYRQCLEALVEGIEDKIVGWTSVQPVAADAIPATDQAITPTSDGEGKLEEGVKKRKAKNKSKNGSGKNKKSGGGAANGVGGGGGGGRFDLLNGLTD